MILSLISLNLIGCAVTAPAADYCDVAKPIYFDSATQVDATPATVRRQILENNETVRRLCQ